VIDIFALSKALSWNFVINLECRSVDVHNNLYCFKNICTFNVFIDVHLPFTDEPWKFNFEVKFYPPDPAQLQEDITRFVRTEICCICETVVSVLNRYL
jgi:hypothetical protein